MAAETLTYPVLARRVEQGELAPVYLLHGEEGYYIDELVKLFEQVLPESERDFNQYILYAEDTDADTVIDTCRRYPMMSEKQVVILKEAQSRPAAYLTKLAAYAAAPTASTILVICVRGEKLKGEKLFGEIRKGGGVVFESKKLTDYNIGPVLSDLIHRNGLNVEPKALEMFKEYVGTDLSRLYNEIGKLKVTLPAGAMVTPEVIERNIGVSKEYNTFEFTSAIARRDVAVAMKIAAYFRKNPKNNAVQAILPGVFNLFSNILIAVYARDKSESGLMSALGFRHPVQLKDVRSGMQNYNAWQVLEIIGLIRRCDAMSKGVGSRQDAYDLLDNLLYRIFNARGEVEMKA